MAVFNAAANQVQISPVTAYKKGKVFRQQMEQGAENLKTSKLQNAALKTEIDSQPARMAAAAKKAALVEENLRSQIQERSVTTSQKQLDVRKDAYGSIISDVQAQAQAGEDVDMAALNKAIRLAVQQVGGDEEKNFLAFAGEDRQLDEDELAIFTKVYGLEQEIGSKADYTIGDTRYSGVTNQPLATNPKATGDDNPFSAINAKDYTQESIASFQASGGKDYSLLVSNEAVSKMTDRDKRIRDYETVLGLDKEMSVKLADDLYTVRPNPKTGAVQIIDEVGGVVREVQVDRPDTPIPTPEKGQTLYDLSTYAAGPINTLAASVAAPAAWLGIEVPEKIISARQTFATANQNFLAALALNKRYPIAEVNRLLEEVALTPKFLDDPKLMQTRIVALRSSLMLRSEQAKRDGMDPNNADDLRKDAQKTAADIDNYLSILGHPYAPDASVKLLRSDPSPEAIKEFMSWYGYLPEGIK